MVDNSERRKRVRSYFFRQVAPTPLLPYERRNYNAILVAIISCFVILILDIKLYTGFLAPLSLLALSIIGLYAASFLITDIKKNLSGTVATPQRQAKYHAQRKSFLSALAHWQLTEDDLSKIPTDPEIDTLLKEDVSSIVPHAMSKLGLVRSDLVRDPLVITGPIIWVVPGIGEDDIVVKKGQDGVLRFSCYRIVVICLSDNRIASFSVNFNFLRYALLGESSVEFLYSDIVAVRTEEKATNYSLPDGKVLKSAQVFRLAVANGDNIEVAVSSSQIRDLFGAEPPPNDYEGTVSVIREMLRDKKG